MNRILTFQMQLVTGLLIGTALSFILVRAFPLQQTVTTLPPYPILHPTSELPGTSAPYVTLPGAWLVRVEFSSSAPPQVLKATYLKQGRITPFDQGDYIVELQSTSGDVLFRGAFTVTFVQGDPPRSADRVTSLLVLPAVQQATKIHLKAPQGETIYAIPK